MLNLIPIRLIIANVTTISENAQSITANDGMKVLKKKNTTRPINTKAKIKIKIVSLKKLAPKEEPIPSIV